MKWNKKKQNDTGNVMDKPDYLIEFDSIISECRKLYKGSESDIGSWIYRQKRDNDTTDLNRVAKDCLWRIQKGISIKRSDT